MLLHGLHLPLTTPFYPDGRLNLRKLEHNVERASRTPANGVALLTAVGEAELLSDEEMATVLRSAAPACAETRVLLADVSRDGVAGTLALAEVAAEMRFDAVMLRVPGFLGRGPGGERERGIYFQAVADRSPLPVVLVSGGPDGVFGMGLGSGPAISVDLVCELAGHPGVIGMVDAGAGPDRLRAVLDGTSGVSRRVTATAVFGAVTERMLRADDGVAAGSFIAAASLDGGGTGETGRIALAVAPPKPAIRTREKVVGFQVLTGRTEGLVEAMEAGAVGAMPPLGACTPQGCYEVLAAWKDGDRRLALEKAGRLVQAAERIEGEMGVAALKYACDLNGYFGGRVRLPLLQLTGGEREQVEDLMRGLRS